MKEFAIKIKNFLLQLGAYGLILVLTISLFGIVNIRKLLLFWIDDQIDYNEWTISLGNKGETDYISNFWGKVQFVNFNGLMRNFIGQQEMNGVVKLNNGWLSQVRPYETDADLQEKADNLYKLDLYLEKKGIPMLFAICPYASSKYDPELPIGVQDYGNDNIDRFMSKVQDYGIDNIDFREEIYSDGLDQYKLMYKTDHHWTTEAGFYAYTKLLKWIQTVTNAPIDEKVKDINNYTMTTYNNWHLGSYGQRTGIYFAGIDDFVLITPQFDTSISIGDETGSFTEMLINYEPLKNKEYTSRYTYDWVLDNSLGDCINNNALNSTKVLIVTDSFGKSVNPYLILSFKEVRYIYDGYSEMLTSSYIEEYNPDVVILLYYVDTIEGGNRGFSFAVD